MRTIAIADEARITTAVGDDAVVRREAKGFPYNYLSARQSFALPKFFCAAVQAGV
jgi:hypothetical protein